MGENNAPNVLIEPTASPHAFSLRPSQAQSLQNADIIFWIGPTLETALDKPLRSIGQKAKVVSLLDTPGLDLLTINGTPDPHVWLSIDNMILMVNYIRDKLSSVAPENIAIYANNAKRMSRRLKLLKRKALKMTAAIKDVPYIVQHDAFGYLARDLGLNQVGYIQTTTGHQPGAKHMANLRALIKNKKPKCLFVEPQFTSSMAETLSQELKVRLREVDALGTDLTTTPNVNLRIVQSIIVAFDKCLYSKPRKSSVEKPQ